VQEAIGNKMSASKFEFRNLVRLLHRSEKDPEVRRFFGQRMAYIERDEYYGTLQFKNEGLDVVFQEAPWVVSREKITDPKELYLAAFHLYRKGYDGFAEYSGELPNGVAFGDSEAEIVRKMGQPIRVGGGGMIPVLKRPAPRWFWYPLDDAILHLQFDEDGRVDLATIQVPKV
jgi:hypothetical protein